MARDTPQDPAPDVDPIEAEPEPESEQEPDDDDALNWAGDDVRGGVAPMTRNRVLTVDDDAVAHDADLDDGAPASIGRSAANVLFAVLFLAVVVGWILSAQITGSTATDLFSQVAWQFGEFVAIISGALWFLAVLTLTTESSTPVRVGWFALGVGVLVPWPVLVAVLA